MENKVEIKWVETEHFSKLAAAATATEFANNGRWE